MQIRKCEAKEIAEIGMFYDEIVLWLDRHINYPKWIYGVYPSVDFVREMTESEAQYICEEEGQIIGTFALNTQPQGNYRNGNWQHDLPEGYYMVLHALAIAPDQQRKGIGTEIIRFCVDHAKAGGFQAIRVDIVPGNYPAKRFHERNGFVYAGDADLELNVEGIPVFSLYELNW